MIVKLQDDTFQVKWQHFTKMTVCNIFKLSTSNNITFPTPQIIAVGYAICSEKDNYSKEIGRKISLTRALKSCEFPKSDRKYIWDKYFSRKEK